MARKIASLYAEISGDTSKLETSLKGTKDKLSGVKTGLSDAVRSVTGFDIASLTAAGAVLALGKGMQVSIKAASDMSETVNKAQVVFGKASDKVMKFGADAALGMGMSKQSALEATATFGNLFVSMGLTADKSADMSTGLVKLAGDLASFNNIDPSIALEKLRAGMVGEVEPLRTLGVNLSAAAVDAKVMEMGLDTSTEALATAAKAQARYALILEQTKTAQGDFARTSQGLANQQRILEAQLADTTAELGKNMLPAYVELVKTANSAASATMIMLTWNDKLKASMAEHAVIVARTAVSYRDYKTEMERSNAAGIAALPIWTKIAMAFQLNTNEAMKLAGANRIMSQAEFDAQVSAENSDRALMAHAANAPAIAKAVQDEASSAQSAADAMKNIWLAANGATQQSLNFGSAVVDLQSATEDLKVAQANWGQTLATDVKAQLEEAGIKGDDLRAAVNLLDQQFGTNMGLKDDYKKAITDIVDQYKRTKDLEGFRIGLGEIDKAFEDLEPDVTIAKKAVDDFQKALNELTSKTYTVEVETHFSGNVPNGTITTPAGSNQNNINNSGHAAGKNAGAANGADFVVPPGYPSDSFNLGLTSGERVKVDPANNKDQETKINIVVNINGGVTDVSAAKKYAQFTADQINRRIK